MSKVKIYWVTQNWDTIRAIRKKFHLPDYMTVNGITEAEVDDETLERLKKGQPKYLILRK